MHTYLKQTCSHTAFQTRMLYGYHKHLVALNYRQQTNIQQAFRNFVWNLDAVEGHVISFSVVLLCVKPRSCLWIRIHEHIKGNIEVLLKSGMFTILNIDCLHQTTATVIGKKKDDQAHNINEFFNEFIRIYL